MAGPKHEPALGFSRHRSAWQADKMQTLCHGDPKGANIMWDEEARHRSIPPQRQAALHDSKAGVSFYDFQWFGKAPPTKVLPLTSLFLHTTCGLAEAC